MRKLLPVLLAVLGLGGGIGAGIFLRPPAEVAEAAAPEDPNAHPDAKAEAPAPDHGPDAAGHGESADEYVKLNNQFVVPVVQGGKVSSLVILSLSLEITAGNSAEVYAMEPKIRDAFLRVLFDHANAGGFDGRFTEGNTLVVLRAALREAAIKTLGSLVKDVLIVDLARQDA